MKEMKSVDYHHGNVGPYIQSGNNNTLTRSARYYFSPRWLGTGVIVVFVLGIVFYAEFVFVNYLFLPELNTTLPSAVNTSGWITCVVWHFLWCNMVLSYLRCIFTEPGGVPVAWMDSVPSGLNVRSLEEQEKNKTICFKCSPLNLKPERAHHCSICKTCVLKMDHHCMLICFFGSLLGPWVNNCVGFRNQKFFILFLLYVSLTSFWYMISLIPMLAFGLTSVIATGTNGVQLLIVAIIGFAFGFGLFCFAFVHFQLAMKNETTIENYSDRRQPNPYDLGRGENFRQVFGTNPLFWLLPLQTTVGDGLSFPRNDNGGDRVDTLFREDSVTEESDEQWDQGRPKVQLYNLDTPTSLAGALGSASSSGRSNSSASSSLSSSPSSGERNERGRRSEMNDRDWAKDK